MVTVLVDGQAMQIDTHHPVLDERRRSLPAGVVGCGAHRDERVHEPSDGSVRALGSP